MKFEYFKKSEISNIDILDSLDQTTLGIFLTEQNNADYWIELKDGFFEFNDGYQKTASGDFSKMVELLEKFIIENN